MRSHSNGDKTTRIVSIFLKQIVCDWLRSLMGSCDRDRWCTKSKKLKEKMVDTEAMRIATSQRQSCDLTRPENLLAKFGESFCVFFCAAFAKQLAKNSSDEGFLAKKNLVPNLEKIQRIFFAAEGMRWLGALRHEKRASIA